MSGKALYRYMEEKLVLTKNSSAYFGPACFYLYDFMWRYIPWNSSEKGYISVQFERIGPTIDGQYRENFGDHREVQLT